MIVRVISKMEAMVWGRGMIYKVVAQSVLLYGSENWVVIGEMLKVLEVFHRRAAWRMAGMATIRGTGGSGSTPWWWRQWKPRESTP